MYGCVPQGVFKGQIPAPADGQDRPFMWAGCKYSKKGLIYMSRIAVVYWSGTGNTKAMADAVAEGAKSSGAEVSVLEASGFTAQQVGDFDGSAFGCPAMGDEVLEESEFDPMFTDIEKVLSGKKTALFGSYGWGDGQWMRDWEERCRAAGAELVVGSVISNDAPGDEETEKCRELGATLA